jgi:hypothetical protein
MSDFNSALPIRSELVGQAVYEDIIIKLGDATNPATQQAAVDTFGSQSSVIKDIAGNAIGDQLLSASYWFQVVMPANGPAAPGTASAFSVLAGGIYNSTPPTLTTGQQSALQLDANGRLLVDAAIVFPYDENWGVVGPTTLRTAAEIGNATGAADFNYGTVGAQTLRVASQIGNATGAADFGAGATDAQTLRVTANQGTPGTAANGWFVRPTDGTNSQAYTAAGEAKVTITEPLPAGTNSIGTVVASNFPTTVDTNYGTVGANTIRTAAQIGNATGAADFNNGATDAQTLRVAANLAVGGANVSGTNPVPVSITSALVGTSINDYNTAAAVAAGGTSNHVYTITSAKTFNGKKIWASASGALKIEVQVSPDGSTYTTKWVGFNSTATPNITIDLDELVFLESGTGSTIRIIRTNEDKKAMDVYSTISGTEV